MSKGVSFQEWCMNFISSIEEGGEYDSYQSYFLDLLSSFINNDEMTKRFQPFREYFLTKVVPYVCKEYSEFDLDEDNANEAEILFGFLAKFYSILLEGISADIDGLSTCFTTVFNQENSCFFYFENSFSDLTKSVLQSKGFDLLVKRVFDSSKSIHNYHAMTILAVLKYYNGVDDENRMDTLQSHIQEYFLNMLSSLDMKQLRALNKNETIDMINCFSSLLGVCESSSSFWVQILKFIKMCLISDFLEKKIMAMKILEIITENIKPDFIDSLKNWNRSEGILSMFFTVPFHEEVLNTFDRFSSSFIRYVGIDIEQLQSFWDEIEYLSNEAYPIVYPWITKCCTFFPHDIFLLFNEYVINSKSPSQFKVDYLVQNVSRMDSFKEEIQKVVILQLCSYLDNNNIENADQIQKKLFSGYAYPYFSKKMISLFKDSLASSSYSKSLISLTCSLVTAKFSSNIIDNDFPSYLIDCLQSGNGYIKELIMILLKCYSKAKQIDEFVLKVILSKIQNDEWDYFAETIMSHGLYHIQDDAIQYLISYIYQIDFSKADLSLSKFIFAFVLAFAEKAKLYTNSDNFRIKLISMGDFVLNTSKIPFIDQINRLLYECQNETTVNYIIDFLSKIYCRIRNLTTEDITIQMIEDHKKFISEDSDDYCKIKSLRLFLAFIQTKEQGFNLEDFGIEPHVKKNSVEEIDIHIINNHSQKITMSFHPTSTITRVINRLARVSSVKSSNYTLYLNQKKLMNQLTLEDYQIESGTTIVAELSKDFETVKYNINSLPSYAFWYRGISRFLLSNISSNNDVLRRTAWDFLMIIPTDQATTALFKDSNNIDSVLFPISNRWLLLYNLQAFFSLCKDDRFRTEMNKSTNIDTLCDVLYQYKEDKEVSQICLNTLNEYLPPSTENHINTIISIGFEYSKYQWNDEISSCFLELLNQIPDHLVLRVQDWIINNEIRSIDFMYMISDQLFEKLEIFLSRVTLKDVLFGIFSKVLIEEDYSKYMRIQMFNVLSMLYNRKCNGSIIMNICIKAIIVSNNPMIDGYLILASSIAAIHPELVPINGDLFNIVLNKFVDYSCSKSHISLLPIMKQLISNNNVYMEKLITFFRPYFSHYINGYGINIDEIKSTGDKGLSNLGATCYMNSVLQQLFAIVGFRNSVLTFNHDKEWLIQLQLVFARLHVTLSHMVQTNEFTKNFKFHEVNTINVCEQQDACEFLLTLIDQLTSLGLNTSLFKGRTNTELHGLNNVLVSEVSDPFYHISVPVKDYDNLIDSLKTLHHEEMIQTEKLDEKKRRVILRKTTRIASIPEVLIIQLKRFEYDVATGNREKLDSRFEFPNELDMSSVLSSNFSQQSIYSLNGVIVHSGGVDMGHYISLIRKNSNWYCYDDSRVKMIDEKRFISLTYGCKSGYSISSAYILIYSLVVQDKLIPVSINEMSQKVSNIICDENSRQKGLLTSFGKQVLLLMYEIDDYLLLFDYFNNVIMHSSDNQMVIDYVEYFSRFLTIKEIHNRFLFFLNEKSAYTLRVLEGCRSKILLDQYIKIIKECIQYGDYDSSTFLITKMLQYISEINHKVNYLNNVLDIVCFGFSFINDVSSDKAQQIRILILKVLFELAEKIDINDYEYKELDVSRLLSIVINEFSMIPKENLIDLSLKFIFYSSNENSRLHFFRFLELCYNQSILSISSLISDIDSDDNISLLISFLEFLLLSNKNIEELNNLIHLFSQRVDNFDSKFGQFLYEKIVVTHDYRLMVFFESSNYVYLFKLLINSDKKLQLSVFLVFIHYIVQSISFDRNNFQVSHFTLLSIDLDESALERLRDIYQSIELCLMNLLEVNNGRTKRSLKRCRKLFFLIGWLYSVIGTMSIQTFKTLFQFFDSITQVSPTFDNGVYEITNVLYKVFTNNRSFFDHEQNQIIFQYLYNLISVRIHNQKLLIETIICLTEILLSEPLYCVELELSPMYQSTLMNMLTYSISSQFDRIFSFLKQDKSIADMFYRMIGTYTEFLDTNPHILLAFSSIHCLPTSEHIIISAFESYGSLKDLSDSVILSDSLISSFLAISENDTIDWEGLIFSAIDMFPDFCSTHQFDTIISILGGFLEKQPIMISVILSEITSKAPSDMFTYAYFRFLHVCSDHSTLNELFWSGVDWIIQTSVQNYYICNVKYLEQVIVMLKERDIEIDRPKIKWLSTVILEKNDFGKDEREVMKSIIYFLEEQDILDISKPIFQSAGIGLIENNELYVKYIEKASFFIELYPNHKSKLLSFLDINVKEMSYWPKWAEEYLPFFLN